MKVKMFLIWMIMAAALAVNAEAGPGCNNRLSNGQTIYVPAYSHIYIGNKEQKYLLTITLSIRNIDPSNPITITEVSYHETEGKFLKNFITAPVSLNPLEATRYLIHQKDKEGGSGANFIVKWKSGQLSNPPIIEAVMIGTQSGQGISFTSRGVPVFSAK
ncbi:MAG: DUF3124 domain-containing protein [Desulfobacteraceae bacterium]|nr:DUF3124 domain-containing protein [Desulfobacteraceae bacterium]